MILKFSELNKYYFNVSDLMAEKQQDIGKKRFQMNNPRPTDALMLFTGAESICYQQGEMPFYIPKGALVYIPKNSRYIWEDSPAFDNDKLEKLLFEFTLNFVETTSGKEDEILISAVTNEHISFGSKIRIISTNFYSLYKKYFERLIEAFQRKNDSLIEPFSVAYDLFNVLSKNCALKSKGKKDYKIIEKGIFYLENTACPDKSVKEIAEMCGVCIGHFERLFKSYAGVSPIEYINSNKILYIKQLLQERNLSLNDIAEKMGYCDNGYLCRIFLKRTGMTPKEYRNLYFSSVKQYND